MSTLREQAIHVLRGVVDKQQPLHVLLSKAQNTLKDDRDKDFLYALCTGAIREYITLDTALSQLLHKALKPKDRDIHMALITGLYQAWYMHTPNYAAVASSVDLAKAFKKPWAKGLINKVLRMAIKQKDNLLSQSNHYAHPQWLLDEFKKAYPNDWEHLCLHNNTQPPMTLRVNTSKVSRESYSQELTEAGIPHCLPDNPLDQDAISLTQAVKISHLPHFSDGYCYIQDLSAQRATHLLAPKAGEQILDACAAPGGKTTHLLTLAPKAHITALDNNAERIAKVLENVERLDLPKTSLQLFTARAQDLESWWDGQSFDRILLDAPCSGTGVIRRHPEIKLHRQPKDLQTLPKRQLELLTALWKTLKPGGQLLYTTCSVLPQENEQLIQRFLEQEDSAQSIKITIPTAISESFGQQSLPSETHDGFYYAMLLKTK